MSPYQGFPKVDKNLILSHLAVLVVNLASLYQLSYLSHPLTEFSAEALVWGKGRHASVAKAGGCPRVGLATLQQC